MDVFELAATSVNIPSQSHMFAEVSFTPQSIQMYNALFEVAMEGASRYERPPRLCGSLCEPDVSHLNTHFFIFRSKITIKQLSTDVILH